MSTRTLSIAIGIVVLLGAVFMLSGKTASHTAPIGNTEEPVVEMDTSMTHTMPDGTVMHVMSDGTMMPN